MPQIKLINFFFYLNLKEVGTNIDAYTSSIFVGVTRFVMSLMNAWLLKRFKRRPLIMVSSLGMAACMFFSGLVTLWIKEGKYLNLKIIIKNK